VATQSSIMNRVEHVLTELEAGQTAPLLVVADGSNGGCSICGANVSYDGTEGEVHIELPSDVELPSQLDVTVHVTVEGEEQARCYVPDERAVNALLEVGQVDWYLPPDRRPRAQVSRVALCFKYASQDGVRSAGMTDARIAA
jgi:hypothetical protein